MNNIHDLGAKNYLSRELCPVTIYELPERSISISMISTFFKNRLFALSGSSKVTGGESNLTVGWIRLTGSYERNWTVNYQNGQVLNPRVAKIRLKDYNGLKHNGLLEINWTILRPTELNL